MKTQVSTQRDINPIIGESPKLLINDIKMTGKRINLILKHLACFMRYTLAFCMLGLLLIPKDACAEIVDRIVAVVNDDIITLFELNRSFQPYAERIKQSGFTTEKEQKMLYKLREEILNQLIDQKIEDQEIKLSNITISEKEIDATIERIKGLNFYSDEDLRAALEKEGITMESYRQRLKEQMLRTKLVNVKVKSKIVITNKDIESYYENNRDKYGGMKKYHLRNIIMKVPLLADEKEKLEIQTRMDTVLEKLVAGESFEALAMTYSESSMAAKGGDLGWFELDNLSPQLQNAIKEMTAGEYTPVLDTDLGYQIFLVEDVVTTPGKPLEEVSPEIERILFNEIVDKKFKSWIEDLRKQAHIKIIR